MAELDSSLIRPIWLFEDALLCKKFLIEKRCFLIGPLLGEKEMQEPAVTVPRLVAFLSVRSIFYSIFFLFRCPCSIIVAKELQRLIGQVNFLRRLIINCAAKTQIFP